MTNLNSYSSQSVPSHFIIIIPYTHSNNLEKKLTIVQLYLLTLLILFRKLHHYLFPYLFHIHLHHLLRHHILNLMNIFLSRNLHIQISSRSLFPSREDSRNIPTGECQHPVLDIIQQILSYTKFFKNLYSKKQPRNIQEKVSLVANIFQILFNSLPAKYKDSDSFTI